MFKAPGTEYVVPPSEAITWGSLCVPWEPRVVSERAPFWRAPGAVTGARVNESPAH